MPSDVLCAFIDKCPSECELIRAIFAEIDACCVNCYYRSSDDGCPEDCLAFRLSKLIPADFDFEVVNSD